MVNDSDLSYKIAFLIYHLFGKEEKHFRLLTLTKNILNLNSTAKPYDHFMKSDIKCCKCKIIKVFTR